MITVINLTNVDFVGEGNKYPSRDRVFNIIHVVIFDASEIFPFSPAFSRNILLFHHAMIRRDSFL